MPSRQVHPVHFDDFSAHAFERLVFAFHLRAERCKSIEWYGQVGSDLGRDILAVIDGDSPPQEVVCIQCVNRKALPTAKAIRDINSALASPTPPTKVLFVCGGSVSAIARDRIRAHAQVARITCEVWSGGEFEERLRARAEALLRRFVEGVEFPDAPAELRSLAAAIPFSDDEAIRLLASVFDRPAFYMRFARESSLPGFRRALDDTIRAIGTGVRHTREGAELPRIPSRHDLKGQQARDSFARIERGVADLRARYDEFIRAKAIKACGESCGQPDCPVYMIADGAVAEMDDLRSGILDEVRRVCPGFATRVGV